MGISIVTDSTSDIEPDRAAALGIAVVPLFVVFGEKSYRDYVDLSRREFFKKLTAEKTLPITSQPTAKMFEEAFAPLVAAGDEILCITISSKLSGTINAARSAMQSFPNAKVTLFDSESAAGGLNLQVMLARSLIEAGESLPQVLSLLEHERQTQRLYACIPDLSHLQRNGRIGKAQAALGTMMKIVPVLRLRDGAVDAEAQVRTFARAQELMLDLTMKNIDAIPAARFLVMHTNAPALAAEVLDRLRERLGSAAPLQLDILEAGPAIAVHAGAGAVGIFSAHG
ncbi:MAG: DegV family protein [Candidatus Eremiobacteraeota bacterium]|nr:DegV family protein [Candidatus Eremiobacteraeota bacterium]